MSELTETFEVATEVTPAHLNELLEFIFRRYLLPNQQYFENINRITVEGYGVLTFTLVEPRGRGYVNVELWARKPILLRMTPSDETLPGKILHRLREDIIINIQFFEEEVRGKTIYFSWREGEEVVPEKVMAAGKRATGKIFSDSMLPLFLIFLSLNFFIFIIFGYLAPLILVVFQLIIIFFSDRIMARLGEWTVSQKNPIIHILQYQLPKKEYMAFRQRFGIDQLVKIKQEIYKKTLAIGEELNCRTAQETFLKYGLDCNLENMSTKKVDVYRLVKEAAGRFNLPVPRIIISNTMLPNAAATGVSPSHGAILITTGLITQLEEEEVLSVLGHEFSHLRGRDPLTLFALSTSEYLFRAYVLFPLIFTLPRLVFFFQLIYFPIVMGAIYFVGKFLEARADLESAIKIGQPKVLAEALRKIGFRRLKFERMPAYRAQMWIAWNPHPPTYFRIERLEKMETPVDERNPLLRSIKDVVNGFVKALSPS
ncbi:MAG: M56 family metallopeptidase [Candidatus Bathyarchaeota archaeon]|nr:M56 family metallopeptidase [Candidatus Bathyarchaeota archaeon]